MKNPLSVSILHEIHIIKNNWANRKYILILENSNEPQKKKKHILNFHSSIDFGELESLEEQRQKIARNYEKKRIDKSSKKLLEKMQTKDSKILLKKTQRQKIARNYEKKQFHTN